MSSRQAKRKHKTNYYQRNDIDATDLSKKNSLRVRVNALNEITHAFLSLQVKM